VVNVAPGYFRNFLAPRSMAALATPSGLKELEFKKKRIEKLRAERRGEAEKLAAKLKGIELAVRHRCGEKGQLFGSVTATDIADALLEKSFEIDRRKIIISTPIKQIGDHEVSLRIYTGVNVPLIIHVKPEVDQEAEIMAALAAAEKDAAERDAAAKRVEAQRAAAEAAEAAEEAEEEGDDAE
jgi:large subunit ribosomal protein L9